MLMGCQLKRDSQAPAHTQLLIGLLSVGFTSGMPVLYSRHGLAMSWTPSFTNLLRHNRGSDPCQTTIIAFKDQFGMDDLVNQGAACCSASGSSKVQLIHTLANVNST